MTITVAKPADNELAFFMTLPTWSCGVSEFPWSYDRKETCLITKGKVRVTYEGGEASFGAGDLVMFPEGMQCVWHVTEPVEKHYCFND